MRIVLFDGIQEPHVATGLRDALERRGHEVRWTGQLWKGYALPTAPQDVARLDAAVDEVLAWRPNALLTFRVAALTPANLGRLRRAGVRLLAWFSDDPVLFGLSTGPAAPLYDVTLHTGGEDVLALYEERTGVRGLTFPFYADPEAFPHAYRARSAGRSTPAAAVFLGNTQTAAKRWRYEFLARSGADLVIYGRVPQDPAGIHAGRLESDADVARVLPAFAVGVSIPQRFADYAGTPYDYPGLAELGWYSLPSRVVQMAAVGLPVVDVRPDGPGPAGVPTVEVRTAEELRDAVAALRDDVRRRAELSLTGREWFDVMHTTHSRAAMVESVIRDGSTLLSASRSERAVYYESFQRPARRRRWRSVTTRWS
ncbi:hypothetical protein ACFP6A_13905 [Quadrisphaera sp. GCM10027208]|uniref:hypothetical protein n=1 Tax=Quadrisphaera sp. GCM10027208 TaxID=3273423 RepID=UPI0036225D65